MKTFNFNEHNMIKGHLNCKLLPVYNITQTQLITILILLCIWSHPLINSSAIKHSYFFIRIKSKGKLSRPASPSESIKFNTNR